MPCPSPPSKPRPDSPRTAHCTILHHTAPYCTILHHTAPLLAPLTHAPPLTPSRFGFGFGFGTRWHCWHGLWLFCPVFGFWPVSPSHHPHHLHHHHSFIFIANTLLRSHQARPKAIYSLNMPPGSTDKSQQPMGPGFPGSNLYPNSNIWISSLSNARERSIGAKGMLVNPCREFKFHRRISLHEY